MKSEQQGQKTLERQNELKRELTRKQREIEFTRVRVENITSTVLHISQPEVFSYLAHQFSKSKLNRKKFPTFFDSLIFWIEGDDNSFEAVVEDAAGLDDSVREMLSKEASIPRRIFDELTLIGRGEEGRPQAKIRDDLILAVWLDRPTQIRWDEMWNWAAASRNRTYSTVVEPLLPPNESRESSEAKD